MKRSAVFVVALTLLVACSATTTPKAAKAGFPADLARVGALERWTSGGQGAVLIRPLTGPATAVVIYHHGASETAVSVFTDLQKRPLITALLSSGYAVAADDAHGDNWGNDASTADYDRLAVDLAERIQVDHVLVLAQSMGGLSGLRSLSRTPNVAAWAGIYPVVNLTTTARSARFAASVKAAYGRTPPPEANPLSADVRVPLLAWASAEDTWVPKAENADRLRGNVTVVTATGEHGDGSHFDAERLVAFYKAALVHA